MMKTWLKRTLLGVAVSSALLGSLAAYSAEGGGFHHGPPSAEQMAQHEAMMLAHIGKKLSLDANQAAKLKALGDLLVAQHAPAAGGVCCAIIRSPSTFSLAAWLASRLSFLPMWASIICSCWAICSGDGGP